MLEVAKIILELFDEIDRLKEENRALRKQNNLFAEVLKSYIEEQ